MRLCLLLEAVCCFPVMLGKAVNCKEKGFESQPWCMMGQHGLPPFLNISLKWPQRKNKYCYMATSHLMGTFDYNHWGDIGAFLIPSLLPVTERQLTGRQPTFQAGASCKGIALPYILFICFCICEEWRYSLSLFVLLGETVLRTVKRTNGPVVPETNNALRKWKYPPSLCSFCFFIFLFFFVFFLFPAHLSEGPFEGQKRISGALSRGLFTAANDDLGNGAYIFCCAPSESSCITVWAKCI